MKVYYNSAPCGTGKSYQAAQRIVGLEGRYIVVRDRVKAALEFQRHLTEISIGMGRILPIAVISNERGRSVRLEVENVVNDYDSLPHVVVIITHKAMQMCDFSSFAGWDIIIDETPNVLDQQELQTGLSVEFFKKNYVLTPLNETWSSVTLTREGWQLTPADLEQDDCVRMLRVFHERVTHASDLPDDATRDMMKRAHAGPAGSRAVISNLSAWDDMQDGRQWTWWSLWSPLQLSAFNSVTIMANAFDASMTFKILRNVHPDIEWIPVNSVNTRNFAHRRVVIEYFARNHVASRALFGEEVGRDNLHRIARYLQGRNQIWMANERHEDYLDGIGGRQLSPQQAGSNQFALYHAATAIYTAKPSDAMRSVLEVLGVGDGAWTHTNEYEIILQFMARTSIRNPDSTEPVTMTVYDENQATYLSDYFAAQPYCDVEMRHVDLDLTDHARKRGRPALVMSPEEADAKVAADRAKRAAAQKVRRASAKAAREVVA